MGGLTVPGPQTGPRRSPAARRLRGQTPFFEWFSEFLRDELRPYPGRGQLVLRYVLAATLTMLVIVTFRIPGAAVGGFYSLLLPRESPITTARSGFAILCSFLVSLLSAQLGATLFVDYPLTHFLWVIGSFFIAFYALSVMTNYAAASAFAVLTVLAVPAWDTPVPTAAVVALNLWVAGSVAVAIAATIVVEAVFGAFKSTDLLQTGMRERLKAVRHFLDESAAGGVDAPTREKLELLAMVGVSRLRQLATRKGVEAAEVARLSTSVSLVGRLVDLAPSLGSVEHHSKDAANRRARLSQQLAQLESALQSTRTVLVPPSQEMEVNGSPILFEMEQTANLLQLTLTHGGDPSIVADLAQPPKPPLFAADAWTNGEHLRFALRGCLASVICYFILNAVSYPGLTPSLFTCVVTALSSIGSSRQKQLLRISGALVGGVCFGLGSQVLILPMLNDIGGFLIMFVVVTSIAAWFITASPRLSYFGTQMALAFYVIHLRGPFAQTNLAIARDNVMGILLGLIVMWIVFDTFGSRSAVEVMNSLFAENLGLLARLAMPWPGNRPADLRQVRALRDKVSQNFSSVNAQADAVLFEMGRSRQASLQLRNTLLGWQPRLRSVFFLEVMLLQYRTRIRPDELQPAILSAQTSFDREMHKLLSCMSKSFEGTGRIYPSARLRRRAAELRAAVNAGYRGKPTARAAAVVALSESLVEAAASLADEIELAR